MIELTIRDYMKMCSFKTQPLQIDANLPEFVRVYGDRVEFGIYKDEIKLVCKRDFTYFFCRIQIVCLIRISANPEGAVS